MPRKEKGFSAGIYLSRRETPMIPGRAWFAADFGAIRGFVHKVPACLEKGIGGLHFGSGLACAAITCWLAGVFDVPERFVRSRAVGAYD